MSIRNDDFVVNVEGVITRAGLYLMIVRGENETHAPNTLSVPGGKVEVTEPTADVLEEAVRREILEEVGVTVEQELAYVESNMFVADDGDRVIDIVFLCRLAEGQTPSAITDEISTLRWMTATEVSQDLQAPSWTRQSIERAEQCRNRLNW